MCCVTKESLSDYLFFCDLTETCLRVCAGHEVCVSVFSPPVCCLCLARACAARPCSAVPPLDTRPPPPARRRSGLLPAAAHARPASWGLPVQPMDIQGGILPSLRTCWGLAAGGSGSAWAQVHDGRVCQLCAYVVEGARSMVFEAGLEVEGRSFSHWIPCAVFSCRREREREGGTWIEEESSREEP